MVEAPGIPVAPEDAEATRRRLVSEGVLRKDLVVLRGQGNVVFPVTSAPERFEFEAREERVRTYQDLLPPELAAEAPRAFEPLGDIVLVKISPALWPERAAIGAALCQFSNARATFHDHGVVGEFRVRKLERIAGEGGSETSVSENGCRLTIDPAAAYFSPRLADERARIAGLVKPDEQFVDMFAGVAPQGIQAARAGAQVTSIDLNPEATRLAKINAEANRVEIDIRTGDARKVTAELAPADRIVMNLPHGAKDFLDAAAHLAAPGAVVHLHEILQDETLSARKSDVVGELASLGRNATLLGTRHVRNYSATESHHVFDLELA